MTAREAIDYIEDQGWSATRLGLERTRELLAALGSPQKKLKFVHVAGSNGKGSTCAMLDAILRAAGYRTGLYTSPYIQEFSERMQVNGQNIPGAVLAEITEEVRAIADAMADHPSQFELVTAIAMVWFLREHCDIVVLEVGMGGVLDSTNVIDAPEVAVITNIGLEHTEYLGGTIGEIAMAKAGIIKAGCECVCYDGLAEALQVVQAVCLGKNVPLHVAEFAGLEPLEHSLSGQRFRWRGESYELALLGEHQLYNAAVTLETVLSLIRRNWHISGEAVREGLRTVKWPARFEVLGWEPLFVLDGGHNPQCAQALTNILEEYLPGEQVTFLMGVLADKDWRAMLDAVSPHAARFVCVTPDSPRALPAQALAEELTRRGFDAVPCESVDEGIRAALETSGPVVAFGSLYMAGAVRTGFCPVYRTWLRKSKIKARDALTPEERERLSRLISERVAASEVFRQAKTILLYRAVRGEVRLEALEAAARDMGKRVAFPLCCGDHQMTALIPHGPEGWHAGYCGIPEPVLECSDVVTPEEIDLVVCPCTVFDESCNRMGMGGGFYDRYLPKCVRAKIVSEAFEVQKNSAVPMERWDRAVDMTFTEESVYYISE